MMYKSAIFCLITSLIYTVMILAEDNQLKSNSCQLPPIETFLLEPIELENSCIWIPVATVGPIINRSCRDKKNCLYSCELPVILNHTKTEHCSEEVARLLAENTACYHEQSLPLTIFNGWQWEYSYSLCQFESVTYDLTRRGGCWQSSWEAILTQSKGSVNSKWLNVFRLDEFTAKQDNKQKSHIKIETFNSMRLRDGYPKKRQL